MQPSGAMSRKFEELSPGCWRPPVPELTSPALTLARSRSMFGSRPAVVEGPRTTIFAELCELSESLAEFLHDAGFERGDRLGVWLPNSTEWVIGELASALSGLVVAAMNVRMRLAELTEFLRNADPVVLLMTDAFMTNDMSTVLADALGEVSSSGHSLALRTVIVVGTERRESESVARVETALLAAGSAVRCVSFAYAVNTGRSASRPPNAASDHEDRGDQPFVAFWTSGTTGTPKGIVHGWNLMNTLWNWTSMMCYGPDDVIVVPRPFYYISGNMWSLLGGFVHGAKLVIVPSLDPTALVHAIADFGGTVVLAGASWRDLLEAKRKEGLALPVRKKGFFGVDAVDHKLVQAYKTEFNIDPLVQPYGMTELQGFATTNLPDDDIDSVCDTVGIALPGREVRIFDENDREVPEGQVGEIRVRGGIPWGHLIGGQLVPAADPNAWYRTEDLGFADAGGYHLVGRVSGLIKVSGERVHLDEVETFLRGLDFVKQASAFDVPDPKRGAIVAAVVELIADDPDEGGRRVLEVSRARLSPAKRPRLLYVVKKGWDWPRSTTGKLRRNEIRARFAEPGVAIATLHAPR